jgi:hypothetical protein
MDTTYDQNNKVHQGDTLINEDNSTYFYDSNGTRVTGADVISKDGTQFISVNYKYDEQGRITIISSSTNGESYLFYEAGYDTLNRVIKMTKTMGNTINPAIVIENYEFDKHGKLIKIKHHDENSNSQDNKLLNTNRDDATIITYSPDGLINRIIYGYNEKENTHTYVEDFKYQSLRQ